jgi:hypothetical protein
MLVLSRRIFGNRMFCAQAQRAFSTEAAEPTQEEIEKGRADWGLKYDDECLKFEKEWKTISDRVDAEANIYVEKELGAL